MFLKVNNGQQGFKNHCKASRQLAQLMVGGISSEDFFSLPPIFKICSQIPIMDNNFNSRGGCSRTV